MLQEVTDKKTWQDVLVAHAPNTFLQSWEWGEVQQATGEAVRHLGWFDGSGELRAVALVIIVNARRGRHYLIPHLPAEWLDSDLLENLIAHLKSTAKHDRVVALRIAPLMENTKANQQHFRQRGFRPAPLHVHAELTWMLKIDQSDDQLLAGMRKTTRHAIRKAEQAGITTSIITNPAEALRRFWPLYEQTRARHGFVLWPKHMIEAQLNAFAASNQLFSVIAQHQGRDVAAAILPLSGDTAFYYHGASLKLPSSLPAAQLLQWAAIKEAKRRGLTRYNFWGIAPEQQPAHPFAGITTFKKGFGGYAIDYLHAQDLPLNAAYWKLWAIEMWRKYRRGF